MKKPDPPVPERPPDLKEFVDRYGGDWGAVPAEAWHEWDRQNLEYQSQRQTRPAMPAKPERTVGTCAKCGAPAERKFFIGNKWQWRCAKHRPQRGDATGAAI